MADVTLDVSTTCSVEDFHDVCTKIFGFPDFYGRNMNAWIDCMGDLDDSTMTRFQLPPDEELRLHLPGFDIFLEIRPDVGQYLIDCVTAVNRRHAEVQASNRISLMLI
ncbi:barstar family protein [Deinococcus sp. AJ005]|uniref:barstar family protein n=1 Tax=Deinococcus sp. AJ005 TaxID=2652443 RepID=UPI00125CB6B8|nr:barstar family protein [Deinococcus sp. AJ005]QFP77132.1 barstar family protein [Deinococcus sp. AJ005]